jgi:hypothetical protein
MTWDRKTRRKEWKFWMELGLDKEAAIIASLCFPDGWSIHFRTHWCRDELWQFLEEQPWCGKEGPMPNLWGEEAEKQAKHTAEYVAIDYHNDEKHPSHWYMKGCDFDEMATKAIGQLAIEKYLRDREPPVIVKDVFPDALHETLMSGAKWEEEWEEEEIYDDEDSEFNVECYDDDVDEDADEGGIDVPSQKPAVPVREPFNLNDFPRLHCK